MTNSKQPKFWVLGAGILVIVLGLIAHQWWVSLSREEVAFHGAVLTHPRPLPAFSMVGTDGHVIDNQSLHGHWTFLFMGFSHCASICPITMAELSKMATLLAKRPQLPRPSVIMITLDPKRDSLQRMQDYVQSFNQQFIGGRGSEEETQRLASFLGIAYTKVHAKLQTKTNDYSIEHSGAIMLLNPRGELVAFFTPPHQANELVEDYQHLVP